MKEPKPVTLTGNQYKQLIEEINTSSLSDTTKAIVLGIMNLCLWLQNKLEYSKITIKRLKRLFFIKTESRKKKSTNPESANSNQANTADIESNNDNKTDVNATISKETETESEANANVIKIPEKKQKRKGHGRRGADEYTAAELIEVNHPEYKLGSPCPTDGCPGKLSYHPPGIFIRVEGGSLFNVYRYERQKLRCSLCGILVAASMPNDIETKYDSKAKALVVIQKYIMGVPWYRLEQWQQQIGAPLPSSTQWDLVVEVYKCVAVIFYLLVTLAAQSKILYQDDTTFKILEVIKENKDKKKDKNKDATKERTGMFTTGIIAEYEKHPICLFFSGTNHAGENLSQVLTHRDETLPPAIQMCDALSSNTVDKSFETIICNCLVHGRRQFVDIESLYPKQSGVVLDGISEIYKNEQYCKLNTLGDDARLSYHQQNSASIIANLKIYMQQEIKNAEPNSPLAAAFKYFLKRWEKFTRFLTHLGAPLDTNLVEQAIKLIIRIRKVSLFYKTKRGATIGSQLISVLQTALKSNINPVDYITALQDHASKVAKNPYDWLPWNYLQTIKQLAAEQVA